MNRNQCQETNLSDLQRGVRRRVILEDAIVKESDAVVGLRVAAVVQVLVEVTCEGGGREERKTWSQNSKARTHEGSKAARSGSTVLVVVIRAIWKVEGDGSCKYGEREKDWIESAGIMPSIPTKRRKGDETYHPRTGCFCKSLLSQLPRSVSLWLRQLQP